MVFPNAQRNVVCCTIVPCSAYITTAETAAREPPEFPGNDKQKPIGGSCPLSRSTASQDTGTPQTSLDCRNKHSPGGFPTENPIHNVLISPPNHGHQCHGHQEGTNTRSKCRPRASWDPGPKPAYTSQEQKKAWLKQATHYTPTLHPKTLPSQPGPTCLTCPRTTLPLMQTPPHPQMPRQEGSCRLKLGTTWRNMQL
ncbi:hypothetical protein CRENBAI_005881 [Crenichthys baileyi]|uniref:Uncharacterized protein n=1 Tax=Crenichthys baileyi TaxID=28760 RepID=A0AAV9RNA1_9TELE